MRTEHISVLWSCIRIRDTHCYVHLYLSLREFIFYLLFVFEYVEAINAYRPMKRSLANSEDPD